MNNRSLNQALALRVVGVLPRPYVGRLIGRFASSRLSRHFIGLFARAAKIDVAEAEYDLSSYGTLTAFFTRKLKAGTRPIDRSPGVLVSPVDGVLADGGPLRSDTTFIVKGRRVDAASLIGGNGKNGFSGGGFSVHYLSPRDYHWIHSPCEGRVTGWAHIPGDFFPVFPMALEKIDGLFTRNERVISFMECPFGNMAVVKVAAMGVGNIKLSYADVTTNNGGIPGHTDLTQGIPADRGRELGVFMLGSTVVLLWNNPAMVVDRAAIGKHLKMGEVFARLNSNG